MSNRAIAPPDAGVEQSQKYLEYPQSSHGHIGQELHSLIPVEWRVVPVWHRTDDDPGPIASEPTIGQQFVSTRLHWCRLLEQSWNEQHLPG